MSIVVAASARHAVLFELAIAAACLGISIPLVARMVRRGPLDGHDRLPQGASAWTLVVALAWGMLVWMAVPVAYVAWRGPESRAAATQPTTAPVAPPTTASAAPTTTPSLTDITTPVAPPAGALEMANLSPREVALLSTLPHLAAFLALILLDYSAYGGNLTRLGLSLSQLRPGLAGGAMMAVAFVPLVFGGAILTDWIYRAVHYTHPGEHALLRVLGESSETWVRVVLAAGAVVAAPLSEELLFRGHMQTILRRALSVFSPPGSPTDTSVAAASPAWATWGAIVFTSALFSAVHEPWTWPPIFLLSVCLGWAYERTGNLWVPVAIHAAFNAVSTILFLSGTVAN